MKYGKTDTLSHHPLYRGFLWLVVINAALYFVVPAQFVQARDNSNSFQPGISTYYSITTMLLLLTWLLYHLNRQRIRRTVLIIHLVWSAVLIIPVALLILFWVIPISVEYIEGSSGTGYFVFNAVVNACYIVGGGLLAGLLFFIAGIQRKG